MKGSILKPLIVFGLCILITFFSAGLASYVETGFGSVRTETGFFTPEKSDAAGGLPVRIAYKLYRPKSADEANPVPAVLILHGYQNDKETSAAFAIELARRGAAVLSVDLYGHGDTKPGMRGRGYSAFKLTSPDKPLKGPGRYHIFMTFSTLDFFRPELSSGMADSSMGGKSAWLYLASLPFVDSNRMGVTGHSMGTWASWSVAAAFPNHRSVVLQCGELIPREYYDTDKIKFNNVLLLQAKYDEFDYFRDFKNTVPGLEKTPLRYHDFMGQTSPVEWNRTYGSFADGSARRMELILNNHRLTTHDSGALTAAMDWFTNALEIKTSLTPAQHIYMIKEVLILIAMLSALVSMLPLFLILAKIKFFNSLTMPLNHEPIMLSPKSRFAAVLIAILVSGLTFPFLGQLGHGLLPLPENIFLMTMGNGFITWLTFLMLVSLVMLIFWYRRGGGMRDDWTLSDLGLEGLPEPGTPIIRPAYRKGRIAAKAIIMAFILAGVLYVQVYLSETLFGLDFRFIWPFFRRFSGVRLGQFFIYLPFYIAFFTVNSGVRLYGQMRLPEITHNGKNSAVLTQLVWWLFSVLVMLGGIFIIALIEYIPFFMGIGPGADLLFTPLFGGPFMSAMILIIPQFAVFFFLSTWFYRKSGTVYTGSFIIGILAAWVVSGGSAMF